MTDSRELFLLAAGVFVLVAVAVTIAFQALIPRIAG